MNTKPPKWADRFLSWYCHEDALEDIQGDLHELFYHRLVTEGKLMANVKFVLEVVLFFRWSNFQNPLAKVGLRNFIRIRLISTDKLIPSERIATAHWNDMVFETRNKDYGAYSLRINYARNLFAGLVVSLILFSSLIYLFMGAWSWD